jgi:hypothetical protein
VSSPLPLEDAGSVERYPDRVNEIIFVVEEAAEGGYTAHALGESIFTEADTIPDLHREIRDAVRCHFDESHVPKVVRLHFVREELLAV